ncbi:hypothetical protein EDB81DRAFT_186217 [Dactylonectria macrodidyma]|uniref:Pre-mRNA splicing factor CLF1 n=1 Tax=Dactylonectria macrodidyma TaxID=307937 RepID=A0A9P9FS75_9HYPO|nr:hypothetical protein EDB81DRAFT_186217 [Dactylonectria macrodidyma]
MSLPDPPTSLDGSCSVIYDGTLYSYSPAGFLSLSLSPGAEWETLPSGETVTGAVCVDASSAGVLWVVGGTGSDSYTGLQKFTYSTGEWTTVTPTSLVSKNLQFHGATYIQDSDAILIYAGSYDGVQTASSETWTIQASEPYNIKAYNPSSHKAIKPILLNWSTAEACFVGGDTANTAVPIFNYDNGWREFSTLAEPLSKDSSSIQAVIVAGSDNSKSLLTFDLSTKPNEVRRFVVQGEDGGAVSNSAAISKRDLTISDWPTYNSSLAPTAIRTNYAIAQGDGTVVFSGGNADEPIAMFDYNENAWLNATQELNVAAQKIESESSSTSSSTKTKTSKTKSTSTSTKSHTHTSDASSTFATSTVSSTATGSLTLSDASASATSTDAAAAAGGSTDDKGGLSSNVVLGVTLGSILGFLAVLILLLLCLRRRKKANKPIDHSRGLSSDEKAPMVFHNAPPPISEPGHLIGHNSTMSQESFSSMAILMGRAGKPKQSGLSRKPSHDTTRSSVSTLHKQLKATIGKPVLQEIQHPALHNESRGVVFDPNVAEPRPRQPGQMETEDGMRRSSGWNRYWSGGSALQILGFGGPKRATGVSDDQSSHYSQSTQNPHRNPRVTQDSATVPPLNFEFRPEFNRVNSGSPVVEKYGKIPFTEGVAGKIERPSSKVSSSGYSSGIPESVNEQWESNQSAKPWGAERATSSVYNPSFYFGTPLSPSLPPPKNHPSGVSNQPQLAMASTSDMSWLNLGDRQQRV